MCCWLIPLLTVSVLVFEQNKTDKLITLVGSNFLVFNNGVSFFVHFF